MKPTFKCTEYEDQRQATVQAHYGQKMNDHIRNKEIPISMFNEIEKRGYFKAHDSVIVTIELRSHNGDSRSFSKAYEYEKGETDHSVTAFCQTWEEGLSSFRSQYAFSYMDFTVDYIEATISWF